jgi:hypothetical protein
MKSAALFLLLAGTSALAQTHPVVFIDGNGSERDAARATTTVKRQDQTMELAKDLLKSCPEISITRKEDASPDYSLLLNRGEEYGLFKNAVSQVMLLDGDQNVLYAQSEGTVAKASKDGCKAILADWKSRRAKVVAPADPKSNSNWNITKP